MLNMTAGTQHDLLPKAQTWLLANGHLRLHLYNTTMRPKEHAAIMIAAAGCLLTFAKCADPVVT